MADPASHLRIGQAAERVYPSIAASADRDDPYVAVALRIEHPTVASTLGAEQARWDDAPFAWPEEAHARRLTMKVRNLMQREPRSISPIGVHLLGNPFRLFAFLADLASGAVTIRREECWLVRDGREHRIGDGGAGLDPQAAVANFQQVVYRTVLLARDLDNQPISARQGVWLVGPEQAVRELEDHPLLKQARTSSLWAMWEDIIRGLALQYGTGGGSSFVDFSNRAG